MKFFSNQVSMKVLLVSVLSVSLGSSLLVGGFLSWNFSQQLQKRTTSLEKGSLTSQLNTQGINTVKVNTMSSNSSAITKIANQVGPAIVGIRTTLVNNEQFWGRQAANSKSEGSGIIISKDGYIMTNYHVVEAANPKNNLNYPVAVEVFLPDKRQAKAKFVGGDALNDLAVLKIELKDLPVAALGDSSQMQVGDLAVAIGNPLGMEFMGSVTSGIVSALNRTVTLEDKTLSLIQTDAAINPGNSGGALVNAEGRVIGVNTVKIAESGVEGLGFAIPINTAKPIVNQLIMYGYVKGRPLIGISGQEITAPVAQYYHLPEGIYVTSVATGTGAEKAGLRKGDIIVSMANQTVKTMSDLDKIKKDYHAGESVNLVVQRGEKQLKLKLKFSEEQ